MYFPAVEIAPTLTSLTGHLAANRYLCHLFDRQSGAITVNLAAVINAGGRNECAVLSECSPAGLRSRKPACGGRLRVFTIEVRTDSATGCPATDELLSDMPG